MKKTLSLFLTLVMALGILTSVPVTVSATSVDDLTFELNDDGKSYSVTECNEDISSELVIPDTYNGLPVTKIGSDAFRNCDSLTSVVIPESVTSIGDSAFYSCSSLEAIEIPDSVTSIGEYAFEYSKYYGNGSNWENNVLYIGNHLIEADISSATVYEIKSGTKCVADCAFQFSSNLILITIPDTVVSIGREAFSDCPRLQYVTLPNSLTSIGREAFAYCANLSSITIPDSVRRIGYSAFYDCTSLSSITIPDSVTTIGYSAFHNTAYYRNETNWVTGVLYIGNHLIEVDGHLSGEYEIQDGIKTIACSAFSGQGITSIIIPSSVTSIGDGAFYECTGLKSIEIPDSVTNIGSSAFAGCSSLTSITIPDSVTSIGACAFDECYRLTSITIPDSVTSIGGSAFVGCSSLTSITIPDSVTSIGACAFYDCEDLASITIPDSVIGIGNSAFGDCSNLTSITIGKSVTSIGDGAFYECYSLTSITIPNSVASIGAYAFYYCTKLAEITISDSVTSIGNGAFRGCTGLTSITVDSTNKNYCSVNGVLFNKTKTELIRYPSEKLNTFYSIPNSVTSIGDEAFSGCTNLVSITIPDSVTSIGYDAFEHCTKLTTITIPDSVTSIGRNAFYNTGYYNDSSNWENGVFYINNHLIAASKFDGIDSYFDNVKGTYVVKEGTKTISAYAFYDCELLASITIPDSVISIGRDAFYNTGYYNDSSNWENGVLYIGNYLIKAKSSLTGACKIKVGTKCIAAYAFKSCESLSSITIPDSVTSINSSAFDGCSQQLVIKTGCSSYALEYANNNNINVEVIDSTHSSSDWIIDKKATCTITGTKIKKCTLCGLVIETQTIDKTSHKSSDWTTDKKATVNSAGKKHKECTECGEVLETAEIPQLKCSKPKLKTIANTEYGVKITWGKVSGADRYRVYRKTSKSNWKYIGYTSKTGYTDKTAKSGTKYYYAVKARNEAGDSSLSSSLSKLYLADPTLKTPSSTKTGVKLTWSKVSGADGYMVYRKTGTGSYSRIATVKGSTKVTYTDKSAKKGKKYTYKVKAYKSKTYGAYSNTKTITDKY